MEQDADVVMNNGATISFDSSSKEKVIGSDLDLVDPELEPCEKIFKAIIKRHNERIAEDNKDGSI